MHSENKKETTQSSSLKAAQSPSLSASEHGAKETSVEGSQDIDVARLRAEFDRLLEVKDRLKRDYLLIRQAKSSDIETSTYKEMFEAHRERKIRVLGAVMPWARGFVSIVGKLTILSGLILFIAEAGSREEAAHNESWRIINEVKPPETSSAGRIGALQNLTKGCRVKGDEPSWLGPLLPEEQLPEFNKWPFVGGFIPDCVSLRGLNASQAHLAEIKLRGATLNSARLQDAGLWKANLTGATLDQAQLMRTKMSEAGLSKASLEKANMQGVQLPNATLKEAELVEADLSCSAGNKEGNRKELCANLIGANLTGADLTGANLTGADLTNAYLSDFKDPSTKAATRPTILYKTNLSNATLSSTQLLGENRPLLCQTQLPEEMRAEIEPDRDCNLIQQALKARYSDEELENRPEKYQAPSILQKQ